MEIFKDIQGYEGLYVQRQLGFNRSSISQCCNGRYKTSYGLHWRYVS